MWNVARNLYLVFFVISFLSVYGWFTLGFAQTNVASPYSGFGIGDVQRSALSRNFALAGLGNALADPFAINPKNPASISSLQTMTMDFSGYGLFNSVKSNQQQANLNTAGLYGLSLVFKKKGPLAFMGGVSPYSTIGYKFSNLSTIDGDTLNFISIRTGQGGLIDYYLGGAYQLFKNRLNIGFTLHYLDGKADVQSITQLPFTYAKVFVKEQSFTGLAYRMGVIFSDTLKLLSKETFYRMGAVIEFAPSIQSTEAVSLFQYRNFLDISTQNVPVNPKELTLIQPITEPENVRFAIPTKYGLGLAAEKFLHYSIGLDVNLQNWKNFQLASANETLDMNLAILAGGEWIPDYQNSKSFLARTAYRMGVGWEKTYLTINDRSINAWRFTLGLGLPVNIRIPSRINLGLEIGQRGTLQNNLIRETSYRLVIGINFNEIWFDQRKYN
jgi:hypothetical protein